MKHACVCLLLFAVLRLSVQESEAETATLEDIGDPWVTPISFTVFVAQQMESPSDRALALREVSAALAEASEMGQAANIVRAMDDANTKGAALQYMVLTLADAGRNHQGLELTRTIDDVYWGALALSHIRCTCAQEKEQVLADAKRIVARVHEEENPNRRASTLELIATTLAEAGDVEQALEVARTMDNVSSRVAGLIGIAMAQVRMGAKRLALATLNQAVEVAQAARYPSMKGSLLIRIALAQAKAGDREHASVTLARAAGLVADVAQVEDALSRNGLLHALVSGYVEVGELGQALKLIQEIDPSTKVFLQRSVASTLVKAGEFEQAAEVARKMEDLPYGVSTLNDIATAQAEEPRNKQRTLATLKQALRLTRQIEDMYSRVSALRGIALTQAKVGDEQQARATLKKALEAASAIDDVGRECSALVRIASAQAEMGDKQQALATLRHSLELAQKIDAPLAKASALAGIASVLAEAGDAERAMDLALSTPESTIGNSVCARLVSAHAEAGEIVRAVEAALKMEDAYWRENALQRIAMTLATQPIPAVESRNPLWHRHNRRMKKAFTPREQQQAKQFVEAIRRSKTDHSRASAAHRD